MNELPHDFDLMFDITTLDQLDNELCYAFTRLKELVDLCEKNGIDFANVPNFKNLTEGTLA